MKERQGSTRSTGAISNTPASLLDAKIEKVQGRGRVARVARGVSVVVGLTYLLFGLILGPGLVRGHSMHPTMQDGDFFIYLRHVSSFEAGDIVVYEHEPGDLRVKRVVGVEGDTLDINRNGELLVNGEVSSIEVFYETKVVPGGLKFPYTVPEHELVLMGDKRDTSLDSREIGAVALEMVKGEVVALFRVNVG